MTPVSMDQEDQLEQVELDLSEAAAGESPAEVPQAVPEQTYDSLFPALPMGATKPARSAVPNNATPMVKVTSSRITQVRTWGSMTTLWVCVGPKGLSGQQTIRCDCY